MKYHNNIVVFIGNGFDIDVMNKIKNGKDTRFISFYNYYKGSSTYNQNNIIIKQMESVKSKDPNWCDVELQIKELLNKDIDLDDLENAQQEIQFAFYDFLNTVVTLDVIKSLLQVSITTQDYINFFADLSKEQYEKMTFHNRIHNNEFVKFSYLNLNYTNVFDNYIQLYGFDKNKYFTSTNNTSVEVNPNKYENHTYFPDPFIRIVSEIFHPHGMQGVPQSMILATETDFHYENDIANEFSRQIINNSDNKHKFIKSLSASCYELYLERLLEGNLFVIYGCSLGESDSWWWSRILYKLITDSESELIIYKFGKDSEETIKDMFINNCCIYKDENNICFNEVNIEKAKDKIFVISYDDSSKIKYLNVVI